MIFSVFWKCPIFILHFGPFNKGIFSVWWMQMKLWWFPWNTLFLHFSLLYFEAWLRGLQKWCYFGQFIPKRGPNNNILTPERYIHIFGASHSFSEILKKNAWLQGHLGHNTSNSIFSQFFTCPILNPCFGPCNKELCPVWCIHTNDLWKMIPK